MFAFVKLQLALSIRCTLCVLCLFSALSRGSGAFQISIIVKKIIIKKCGLKRAGWTVWDSYGDMEAYVVFFSRNADTLNHIRCALKLGVDQRNRGNNYGALNLFQKVSCFIFITQSTAKVTSEREWHNSSKSDSPFMTCMSLYAAKREGALGIIKLNKLGMHKSGKQKSWQ